MNLHQAFLGWWGATFLLWHTAGLGQTGISNARSFALGGAYTALASGVETGRWNPANLALRRAPDHSAHFASFGAAIYNNAFAKSDYDFFNGAHLTTEHKISFLQKIPAEGLRFDIASEFDVLGFSYRHYALTVAVEVAAAAKISRDFLDLVLNGNQLHRRYDFSATGGSGLAAITCGLSYAKPLVVPVPYLKELALGVTVKYVRGFAFAEVKEAAGSMITTFEGISGDARARLRTASGGNGLALDLGAAAVVNKQLSLGLALRNFLGLVYWNRGAKEYKYGINANALTATALSSKADSAFHRVSEERDLTAFFSRLPAALHLGAAYDGGYMLFTGELVQGLQNGPASSTTPELRFGVEERLTKSLLPRFGVKIGGRHGISTAIGLGFRAREFQLDIATGTWGGILPGRGKGVGFALGMREGL